MVDLPSDGPGLAGATGPGTWVEVGDLSYRLEGASRPGHFRGVATVVLKLLNVVNPDVVAFGRKDAQQCLVIGQMVEDLKMPVGLIDGPTVREPDGLAMSSRNRSAWLRIPVYSPSPKAKRVEVRYPDPSCNP